LGHEHAVALSSHGRVFTWGQMEACTSSESFKLRCLPQPLVVEGALRGTKVMQVTAGQTSSSVFLEDGDIILGWDMVEITSAKGSSQVLPAVYEYVMPASAGGRDSATRTPTSPGSISPSKRKSAASTSSYAAADPTKVNAASSDSRARSSTPTNGKTRSLQKAAPRERVALKHSPTLQLTLLDGRNRPSAPMPAHSELFSWSQLHSSAAQLKQTESPEERQLRSRQLCEQERSSIKAMDAQYLATEVRRPRRVLELDREIARYRRLMIHHG